MYSFIPETMQSSLALVEHFIANISIISADNITSFAHSGASADGTEFVHYTNADAVNEIKEILDNLGEGYDFRIGSSASFMNNQQAMFDYFLYSLQATSGTPSSDADGIDALNGVGADELSLVSGVTLGATSGALDKCAKFYLDSLDDSKTHSIFYFVHQ